MNRTEQPFDIADYPGSSRVQPGQPGENARYPGSDRVQPGKKKVEKGKDSRNGEAKHE